MAAGDNLADTTLLAVRDYAAPGESLAAALGVDYALIEEHRFPRRREPGHAATAVDRARPGLHVAGPSERTPGPAAACAARLACSRGALDRSGRALPGLHATGTRRSIPARSSASTSSRRCSRRRSMRSGPWIRICTGSPSLDEVFPRIRSTALTAGPLLADWVRAEARDAVLIGPDREAAQWVRGIAEPVREAPGVSLRRPGWAIAKCASACPTSPWPESAACSSMTSPAPPARWPEQPSSCCWPAPLLSMYWSPTGCSWAMPKTRCAAPVSVRLVSTDSIRACEQRAGPRSAARRRRSSRNCARR
jgi:hypothetical protein